MEAPAAFSHQPSSRHQHWHWHWRWHWHHHQEDGGTAATALRDFPGRAAPGGDGHWTPLAPLGRRKEMSIAGGIARGRGERRRREEREIRSAFPPRDSGPARRGRFRYHARYGYLKVWRISETREVPPGRGGHPVVWHGPGPGRGYSITDVVCSEMKGPWSKALPPSRISPGTAISHSAREIKIDTSYSHGTFSRHYYCYYCYCFFWRLVAHAVASADQPAPPRDHDERPRSHFSRSHHTDRLRPTIARFGGAIASIHVYQGHTAMVQGEW